MFADKNTLVILFIFILNENRSILGNVVDSAKIIFYFGPTYEDNQSYDLDKVASILEHPKFVHKKTSCYLHGYVDFAALVNGSFIEAQRNILELVPRISNSILDLIDAGLDVNSISLVGHSLGGVAIGLIGRDIYRQTNGSVLLPRITPLDPSNPDAHDDYILPVVEKTDARFVDVIHASAGQTATSLHTGHADFWPNGGKIIQPGCPEESINKQCSHHKAFAYWAQSVAKVNTKQLLSYRATSYEAFLENKDLMKSRRPIYMGVNCPQSACGDYYLQLDSNYGENGDPSGLPK